MTTSRRPTGLAVALFLAPWGFLAANTAYALSTADGGSDSDGAGALALAAAHPSLYGLSALTAMLGSLLMMPAILGIARIARDSSRRLIGIAAPLTAAAYICYFAIAANSFVPIAMAEHGGPLDDYAAVLDKNQANPLIVWVFLLFVLGNLVGTVLLAVALWRSHAVATWVAIALGSWAPLHVIGLVVGTEWFEVAGALAQAVAFAATGSALLRAHPTP